MFRTAIVAAALLLPSAALAGFEASSFKRPNRSEGKNYWNAGSALDNNMETCWQVDPEKPNEGQWISVDVPAGTVDKVAAVVGWQKDDNTFGDYARIKSARVEIFNLGNGGEPELVGEGTVEFEDKPGWQIVDVPDTKVGGEILGGKVKIHVTGVYEGKDFGHLAVSEVRVHMLEFPAETLDFATVPDSEVDGHSGADMIDNNARSFWAATGDTASFAMKAPGYGLASLGVQSGPKSYARPKTIKITAQQNTVTHVLEDKPGEMQWALLPVLVGYTGGAWGDIQVEIVDTWPGDAGNGVAISEIKLNAGSIEDF
jgi:hypothetical protein